MDLDGKNHCHLIVTFLCYVFFHAYPFYTSGYSDQYGLMDAHSVGRNAMLQ